MAIQRSTASSAHRTPKGAQRVDNLTVVAAQLFLERGFDAVAVDDLIARVGGSRRNVYSHFGGKEGLFEAAMMHICAEMAKPLEEMNIQGLEVERVLSGFGIELVRIALSPRTLAVHRLLTTEGKRFPEIAQAMLACSYQKVIAILARWIAEQQAQAEPAFSSAIPADALAVQFVSMISSDLKLRAIVGLIPTELSAEKVDSIVASAVHTFLYGAATGRVDRAGLSPRQP
ncbi:TetR/AcrR family transcriptional regulator [Pseudomonas capsici]|uniref:TetR/AcrR family transcriptional regulator n=1 Tax=Pseudomonas capsici TaxID=2810614 RepID=UPI000E3E2210|nr:MULTISPECIES: TetR/AcrR family transcriptional regulator [Pseudomonas]MBX8609521.1 TetR/AcrR family transcriptional regulator [Pseudomonas cichorii]MBX8615117.1 TetR/AcrR family transcriptional regulator [Pseudomonas cichorii]MCV4272496.1 TetR/AcrR family transcriptional regulator [Pseudomonas capsici]MCV4289698.1 TetR/AcrR family transcriptional regulator [Pseudomonas capsici]GFM57133.1 TetR family transcriptional regulator [Pseudomonas cichorii]